MKRAPIGIALVSLLLLCGSAMAQTTKTLTNNQEDTSTDFLSSREWRRLPPRERHVRARASYVARFEPSGTPSIERLAAYIGRYAEINIFDSRLAVFNVTANHVKGTTGSIELSGEVSVGRFRVGIESTLDDLGFNVVKNDIVVLPSADIGPEIYGVARFLADARPSTAPQGRMEMVSTATATLRREPRKDAEQMDSVAAGDWVRLLRPARPSDLKGNGGQPLEGKWMLAQSVEGYVGFVREEDFDRTSEIPQPDAMLLKPARTFPEGKRASLPSSSLLYLDDTQSTEAANQFTTFDRKHVIGPGARLVRFRPSFTPDEILSATEHMLGTPYEWGGITENGIDCSGLSQFLYKTRGIFLPRDAEEQSIVGRIVAFGSDEAMRNAQPGDQIFFLNGRGKINHVATSLGGNRIVHSSGRNVHVTTLDARREDTDDDSTATDRILWVRRVLLTR